jgi:hypothetical protein
MATFGSRSSLELSSPQRLRLRSCFRRDSAKSAIDVTERCTISVLIITDVRMCNKTLRWTVLPKYDDEFYINPHFCQQSLHHSPPSSSHSYTPALTARVRRTSFFHLHDGGIAAVCGVDCRRSRNCHGLHLSARWSYAVQSRKPVPFGQP